VLKPISEYLSTYGTSGRYDTEYWYFRTLWRIQTQKAS